MFKETIAPLSNAEISKVTGGGGGKYYGNGVYCTKKKCYVNWREAINSIGNNMAANWFTGGQAGWNSGIK
ncbi:leucocin A/sakacin P family class II bacteriocin [Lacticaseibacillus parahuelsenbergensis]|uniref:Leucocin A/sakacin P family class II bacteriocin n=1 Tax=Lacticaseibacillus parahuelsenbergensis TaxID=3068305 RepID=A0ABY9L305_9LACO|nr:MULTISPECIES: leucocin A/sakacin P family class II bacteriocin [Lacticaseibacillus]MDE3281145.1 class II bacteriocin [Lacticaseibacillus casei]WLV78074.1 leucocin A/sakacin P family class II bacteriocin [Lacticaseibacillus sp. NCIMB 15471]